VHRVFNFKFLFRRFGVSDAVHCEEADGRGKQEGRLRCVSTARTRLTRFEHVHQNACHAHVACRVVGGDGRRIATAHIAPKLSIVYLVYSREATIIPGTPAFMGMLQI